MCIYNRTEETAPKMPQNFVYSKPKELWESSRWQLKTEVVQNWARCLCLTTQTRGCLKPQVALSLSAVIIYKGAKEQLPGFKIKKRAVGK